MQDNFEQVFEFLLSAGYLEGMTSPETSPEANPETNPETNPELTPAFAELPDGPADDHGLTARQRKILEVISTSVSERGFPPTMREIGAAVGLASSASVAYQLSNLVEKGLIKRSGGRQMDVISPESGKQIIPGSAYGSPSSAGKEQAALHVENTQPTRHNMREIPLIGRIAAGAPILAEAHVEESYSLPAELVGSGELFLLTVVGDSMVDAAICDGDLVVIRAQKHCEPGEIVAAMIDGEATVKTFKRSDGHVWLMPANPAYAPILGDHAEILGKVTAVLRSIR